MSSKTKEGFLLGAVYLIVLYLTIFIPGIELITIFILPIPYIIFASRYGWKPAVAFFSAVLFVSFLFAAVVAVPLTLLTGLGGTLIGLSINQKLSPYETLARGTVGYVIGILFIFIIVQLLLNINMVNELKTTIEQSVATSQGLLDNFGLETSTEQLNELESQMLQITSLLPVVFVIIALVLAFLSQWLGYKALKRTDKLDLKFPPFRNYQLPKIIIWIYFIIILLSWFGPEPTTFLYQIVVNVTNLIGLFITLQGISLVLYYAYVKGMSKAIPIITIVMCIVFPFIGLYLMRILGIIDLGFSLRERITNTK